MAKLMGIDYGDKRTGIALSDIGGTLAFNFTTIESGHPPKVCNEIMKIIEKEGIETVVMGLPLNMDGSEGPRAEKTRAFAQMITDRFDGRLIFKDERLTTVSASYYMNETNTRGAKRKELIDRVAASIILQSYIDSLK